MTDTTNTVGSGDIRKAYLAAGETQAAKPIWLLRPDDLTADGSTGEIGARERAWLKAVGFKASARKHALLPDAEGGIAGAVLGLGSAKDAAPYEPLETLVGLLPTLLPAGDWRLASSLQDMRLAALAWGLGSYKYNRYKKDEANAPARLVMPDGIDGNDVLAMAEAVALGRDLINTPANDMGPAELEDAARRLAARHGAEVSSVVGDDLLAQNFPLIHAVGRASPRAPRLIELRAGRSDAPKITIIGKGICFDTGGLDIKPPSAMLLMKKDMGGAATALALAHMILAGRLDVRLRVLLPTAENSVSGNAFRPGDVIRSRSGRTVEIGNTDAEGRLVLADALSLADEEAPDQVFMFATLTGAARVALGPDMVPFYTNDTPLAEALARAGEKVSDALWRMPLATPYEGWLDSKIADMNNIAEGGFAGSIVAAIFLNRFIKKTRSFAHFDIYGWRPQPKPMGPRGGEPHAARAVYEALKQTCSTRSS